MIDRNPNHPEEEILRLIIRDEVSKLIQAHEKTCQFVADEHPTRLRKLENRLSTLIGLMTGSGLIGGGISALATKLLS